MARAFARAFYASKAWKNAREAVIAERGGLCEECLSKGLYNAGYVIHHITELTPQNINDPAVALNPNNLMLLCRECHEKIHQRIGNGRYEFNEDGSIAPLWRDKTRGGQ